ncbi:MAG: M56 family metallopeptidase [Muribaculaceae bacterium]|nr:M56 family metallopeptidase [Muribaculaceae bacterium]
MGALLSYSLVASIFLLLFYPVMSLVVTRSTNFRFNRIFLLAGMGLCLLLPFFGSIFGNFGNSIIPSVNPGLISLSESEIFPGKAENNAPAWINYMVIVIGIYILGILALTLREIYSFIRLQLIISRGEKVNEGKYIICVLEDLRIAPFSWRKYIFFNKTDIRKNEDCILLHEKSHIDHCHWIDLLLSDVFCLLLWYNPFAWRARRLVRLNHEFQADSDVIASGIEPYAYQRLILETAMDRTVMGVANCFGSNKKGFRKRVLAIGRTRSSRKTLLLSLCLLPATVMGIMLTSFTVSSDILNEMAITEILPSSISSENNAESTASSFSNEDRAMPEFEGGVEKLYEFLAENMRYPETPEEEEGKIHKVYVYFDIDIHGNMKNVHVKKNPDSEYAQEAMRMIKQTSGKWKPAIKNGKPIETSLSLPFYFSTVERN